MKKSIGSVVITFVFLTVLLSGCAPASTLVPPSPTLTPERVTLSGNLIGPDEGEPIGPHGPIAGAQVMLKAFQDEECVKLAESTSELSEEENKQLDDCTHEAGSTTSDAEGRWEFLNVDPGWYTLRIDWELSEPPDIQFGFLLEFRDGFFVTAVETNETPKRYFGRAVQQEIFYFSAQDSMVVDFDYNKK